MTMVSKQLLGEKKKKNNQNLHSNTVRNRGTQSQTAGHYNSKTEYDKDRWNKCKRELWCKKIFLSIGHLNVRLFLPSRGG